MKKSVLRVIILLGHYISISLSVKGGKLVKAHFSKLFILLLIVIFIVSNFTHLSAEPKSMHESVSPSSTSLKPTSEVAPTPLTSTSTSTLETISAPTNTQSSSETSKETNQPDLTNDNPDTQSTITSETPLETSEIPIETPETSTETTTEEVLYPIYKPDPSRAIDPKKPMIALTFDDGPSAGVTNRILDLVEKYDIRVTFFVVGDSINRSKSNRAALCRADSLGCEIGNHTYTHKNLTKIDSADVISEISKTEQLINEIISKSSALFRPPYGSINQSVLESTHMPFVLWSVDTEDWKSRDVETILSRIEGNVKDGDILLMHDIFKTSADACEMLIPKLIEEGYQLVTVSELFLYKNIPLESLKAYRSPFVMKKVTS